MSDAKENILKKIRSAKDNANLWNNVSKPKTNDFFTKSEFNILDTFKLALEKINGELLIANQSPELEDIINQTFSEQDVICTDSNLQEILKKLEIPFSDSIDTNSNPMGFINCEFLVARLGSVLTSSNINSGRQLNIFPEHQVVFATKEQLVDDIKEAIEGVTTKYPTLPSMISFATGPSRTADIEKTLILGAHGPKLLTIILQNY